MTVGHICVLSECDRSDVSVAAMKEVFQVRLYKIVLHEFINFREYCTVQYCVVLILYYTQNSLYNNSNDSNGKCAV